MKGFPASYPHGTSRPSPRVKCIAYYAEYPPLTAGNHPVAAANLTDPLGCGTTSLLRCRQRRPESLQVLIMTSATIPPWTSPARSIFLFMRLLPRIVGFAALTYRELVHQPRPKLIRVSGVTGPRSTPKSLIKTATAMPWRNLR